MFEFVVTGIVLVLVIAAITTRCIPTIAVGLLIPLVLSVLGVIPAATAFSALGSKTTFLIIGALVIGDACFRTGLTELIGTRMIRYTAKFRSEPLKLLVISLLAAVMSAFLSSLGVQVALMALIVAMSQALHISKSRAMLALGYSASIGGMWSIIGTTIMMLAKSAYEGLVPGETIGMFELSAATVPIGLVVIVLYCFLVSRRQPDRCQEEVKSVPTTGEERTYSRRDITIVAVTFFGFIVLVALDGQVPLPANMVAVLVFLVLGFTGISSVKDMVNCISWDVIFFILGITVLSDAMAASGLSDYLGKFILELVGNSANPYVILGVLCTVCALLTQVMSNSGAFGVVLPFLPVIAGSLNVALKPLMAATIISCTCGFCLPISAPSYLMLAEEGKLRVGDWFRCGLPLVVVANIMTVLLVPALWPL